MYRVGIIGHTPEYFKDWDIVKRLIGRAIELISFQYQEDLIFNISGTAGVGSAAAEYCRVSVSPPQRYHLFNQWPIEDMKDLWKDEQFKSLMCSYTSAWGLTISFPNKKQVKPELDCEFVNYKHMVDNSDFVIYFWNGMKQGAVYDSIKYSLATNVLSINWTNDRQLITNEDI